MKKLTVSGSADDQVDIKVNGSIVYKSYASGNQYHGADEDRGTNTIETKSSSSPNFKNGNNTIVVTNYNYNTTGCGAGATGDQMKFSVTLKWSY